MKYFTLESYWYRLDPMEPAASPQSVCISLRHTIVWLAKAAAGVAIVVLALVGILLLVMWREHKTAITLPTPTGPFAVGRTTYAWTNEAVADELAFPPGPKRQVLVWVWYPAIRSPRGVPAEYPPVPWREALAKRLGVFMRTFFKRDPALVHAHSVSDTMVSPEKRTYPVVLLRAGGSALTTDFTTLAENLASHGFFVVGFDAPYRSFVVVLPDGRIIARSPAANVENANGNLADPVVGKLLAMWASDTTFVVDQLQRLNDDPSERFAGRMDLQRLGCLVIRSAARPRSNSAARIQGARRRSIWTAFRSAALSQKGSASPVCFFSATTVGRWPIQKAAMSLPKSSRFTTACPTSDWTWSFGRRVTSVSATRFC